MARRLNIDGDGQGDLVGHGGEHRAVFVYQMDSYRLLAKPARIETTSPMGSSARISRSMACPMQEVCIGDRYRIGGALFEVTQPRVTCYRMGIRMNEPQMAALLVAHGRPGFYFRVLEEGEVEAGDEIIQVASGPEQHERLRDRCTALHARSPSQPAGACAAHPGAERRLACAPSRHCSSKQRSGGTTTGNAGLAPAVRAASGMARVPPAAGVAQGSREQQRHLADARARGRASSRRGPARAVCCAAA